MNQEDPNFIMVTFDTAEKIIQFLDYFCHLDPCVWEDISTSQEQDFSQDKFAELIESLRTKINLKKLMLEKDVT